MPVLSRIGLTILAVLFLVEAWIWDACAALGRWLARVLRLAGVVEALRRMVARTPPPLVLALFVIPVAVILPFKIGALWLIARGHFLLGGLTFFAAKTTGVGVSAVLFDLCRERLLLMAWFARLYGLLLALRAWAHELVAPARAQVAAWRARARRALGDGRLGRRVAALRAKMRKRAYR